MGGNIFNNTKRINREDIDDTIEYLADHLSHPDLTVSYMKSALLGSAGKQETSGDLDIVLNTTPCLFYGQDCYPTFEVRPIVDHLLTKFDQNSFRSMSSAGQLHMSVPIAGDPAKGHVQVDFIYGDFEFAKFTAYSPGADSQFKGLVNNTFYGSLAKQRKDYEDEYCRVQLYYDLRYGLHKRWRVYKGTVDMRQVTPDEFETMFDLPRFSRIGFVTNVDEMLRMLWGFDIRQEDVNTFEKIAKLAKENFSIEMRQNISDSMCASLKYARYFRDNPEMEQVIKDMLI